MYWSLSNVTTARLLNMNTNDVHITLNLKSSVRRQNEHEKQKTLPKVAFWEGEKKIKFIKMSIV